MFPGLRGGGAHGYKNSQMGEKVRQEEKKLEKVWKAQRLIER